MMTLTQQIKRFALDQGFCRVGIAPADDFEDHMQELLSRGSLYDFYTQGPHQPLLGAQPTKAWPAAKSVIILAYDYTQCAFPANLTGKVARVYQSRSMNAQRHRMGGLRLEAVKAFVRDKGIGMGPSMMMPERSLAVRGGICNIGRNNFAFVDGIGSFINLSHIVVDRVLEYDAPNPKKCKCPPGCTACIDACPTRAIYAPFHLNPRGCINFNTSMAKLETGFGVTDTIPQEIRGQMGQAIFGCDICQAVCPRNAKRLNMDLPKEPFLEEISQGFSLVGVLHMQEGYFEAYVQPIAYNFGLQPRYLQRNAAVALGNTRDPVYLADLSAELAHEDPMIRGHVAWAIGQIGTALGKELLSAQLARETDDEVRLEITQALACAASRPADE